MLCKKYINIIWLEWKIIHILKANVFLLLWWFSVKYIIPGSRKENTWKPILNDKICNYVIILLWSPYNLQNTMLSTRANKGRHFSTELKFKKEHSKVLCKLKHYTATSSPCAWMSENYLPPTCQVLCARSMKYKISWA